MCPSITFSGARKIPHSGCSVFLLSLAKRSRSEVKVSPPFIKPESGMKQNFGQMQLFSCILQPHSSFFLPVSTPHLTRILPDVSAIVCPLSRRAIFIGGYACLSRPCGTGSPMGFPPAAHASGIYVLPSLGVRRSSSGSGLAAASFSFPAAAFRSPAVSSTARESPAASPFGFP